MRYMNSLTDITDEIIQKIINNKKDSNSYPLKEYVESLLSQNLYTQDSPSYDGSEITAYKNHIKRVTSALQSSGVDFYSKQQGLMFLNPGPVGTGKILNPATPFGPPPHSKGMSHALDVSPWSEGIKSNNEIVDIHKKNSINMQQKNERLNLYQDDKNSKTYFYTDTESPELQTSDGIQNATKFNVVPVPSVDISYSFEESSNGPNFGSGPAGYKSYIPKKQNLKKKTPKMAKKEKQIEDYDSFFSANDVKTGLVSVDEFNAEGIEDTTNYMPFFLEDMRRTAQNQARIYFRAFFKNLSEQIAPNWNKESYFGRVDAVPVYMNTSRTIPVSFAIVSTSPAGFTAMWRKVNQLTKLAYPTMENGVMTKAPVCRLRIGDVICDAAGNGLTGFINSAIQLDYSDSTWEISEWLGWPPDSFIELGKAPMMINCSFTFEVIHEQSPKVDADNNFDTTFFRRIGTIDLPQDSEEEVGTTDEGVVL